MNDVKVRGVTGERQKLTEANSCFDFVDRHPRTITDRRHDANGVHHLADNQHHLPPYCPDYAHRSDGILDL